MENEKRKLDKLRINKETSKLADFEADTMELELMIKRDNLKKVYGFDITIADYLKQLRFIAKSQIRISIFLTLFKAYMEKSYFTFNTIKNLINGLEGHSSKLSYHLTTLCKEKIIKKVEMYHTSPTKAFHTFYRLRDDMVYVAYLLFEYIEKHKALGLDKDVDLLERPDILFDLAIKTSEIIIQQNNTYSNVVMFTYLEVHKDFLDFKKQVNIRDIIESQDIKRKKESEKDK